MDYTLCFIFGRAALRQNLELSEIDGFNFDGISAPTTTSQISKVEKQNNLAINVFGWEQKSVIIHEISKQPANIKRINTLVIEKDGRYHYTWIKNLNRLLFDQNKHIDKSYFC